MDLNDNLTQVILAIIGVIAGGATLRIVRKNRIKKNSSINNSNSVTIKNNLVTGDVAGRDIIKKRR